MKLRLLLATIGFLMVTATTASAQIVSSDDSGSDVFSVTGISDGCSGTMSVDECMWSSSSGGKFTYCMAMKDQGCQDAVQSIKYPTRKVCASVQYNAGCYCDSGTLTTSGVCEYKR